MRTKTLILNKIPLQCILVAGGIGFKLYASSEVSGYIINKGKNNYIVNYNASKYQLISKYINLKYQPLDQKEYIISTFNEYIQSLQ